MKLKILKTGRWNLTGIGPSVDLVKGEIETISEDRITYKVALKMINAGWAEEAKVEDLKPPRQNNTKRNKRKPIKFKK